MGQLVFVPLVWLEQAENPGAELGRGELPIAVLSIYLFEQLLQQLVASELSQSREGSSPVSPRICARNLRSEGDLRIVKENLTKDYPASLPTWPKE